MSALPINGLDLAVIIILLVSALLALMRGFVQETLSIGAWIGASFGSLYGVRFVHPLARRFIPLDWAADAVSVVVLFLAILFALSLLTNMISGRVQRSGLNPLDRSLGFVFGLVRGAVIVCVAMIIADWLMKPVDRPQWMQAAKATPMLEDGASVLKSLLPESFQQGQDAAKDAAAKVDQALEAKRNLDRLTGPAPTSGDIKDAVAAARSNPETAKAIDDLIGRKMQEIDAKDSASANNGVK